MPQCTSEGCFLCSTYFSAFEGLYRLSQMTSMARHLLRRRILASKQQFYTCSYGLTRACNISERTPASCACCTHAEPTHVARAWRAPSATRVAAASHGTRRACCLIRPTMQYKAILQQKRQLGIKAFSYLLFYAATAILPRDFLQATIIFRLRRFVKAVFFENWPSDKQNLGPACFFLLFSLLPFCLCMKSQEFPCVIQLNRSLKQYI